VSAGTFPVSETGGTAQSDLTVDDSANTLANQTVLGNSVAIGGRPWSAVGWLVGLGPAPTARS
jgi:hypothetical protein